MQILCKLIFESGILIHLGCLPFGDGKLDFENLICANGHFII